MKRCEEERLFLIRSREPALPLMFPYLEPSKFDYQSRVFGGLECSKFNAKCRYICARKLLEGYEEIQSRTSSIRRYAPLWKISSASVWFQRSIEENEENWTFNLKFSHFLGLWTTWISMVCRLSCSHFSPILNLRTLHLNPLSILINLGLLSLNYANCVVYALLASLGTNVLTLLMFLSDFACVVLKLDALYLFVERLWMCPFSLNDHKYINFISFSYRFWAYFIILLLMFDTQMMIHACFSYLICFGF